MSQQTCARRYRVPFTCAARALGRQSALLWPHQPSGQGSFWANSGMALTRDNRHFYNRNFCRGPTIAE